MFLSQQKQKSDSLVTNSSSRRDSIRSSHIAVPANKQILYYYVAMSTMSATCLFAQLHQ